MMLSWRSTCKHVLYAGPLKKVVGGCQFLRNGETVSVPLPFGQVNSLTFLVEIIKGIITDPGVERALGGLNLLVPSF